MSIELTDAGRNEYEALVRDAKRYRWLRGCDYDQDRAVHSADGGELKVGEALDAAIDAEMEAVK